MDKPNLTKIFAAVLFSAFLFHTQNTKADTIKLPSPSQNPTTLDASVQGRHSSRSFDAAALPLRKFSDILFAAYGLRTDAKRTVPSAGAVYPLTIYICVVNVEELEPGTYIYKPQTHSIESFSTMSNALDAIQSAAFRQRALENCAAVICIAGTQTPTARKYGKRAPQYVFIEAGTVCQNIGLYCAANSVGTVIIGAFNDNEIKTVLGMQSDTEPICLMPVGNIKE